VDTPFVGFGIPQGTGASSRSFSSLAPTRGASRSTSHRPCWSGSARVEIVAHDLDLPLPDCGRLDAVVSSFAVHKLLDVETQLAWLRAIGFTAVDATGSGGSSRCSRAGSPDARSRQIVQTSRRLCDD
jgi:hypothetical protein